MGGTLNERVERRLDVLARRMLDTIVAEVPLYGLLPREQLEGEVLDILRTNLELFFASLRKGHPPTDAELADVRASAARRAEERVPLGAVLTAYHVGGRVGWDELRAEATPEERDELLALASGVMAYVQAVTSAVAAAYLEEQQAIYGEEREAQRALVRALLDGAAPEAPAARAGVRLAAGYAVVALELVAPEEGEGADAGDEGVAAAVGARRRVRRMEQAAGREGGAGTLCLLHPAGGEVLVPAPSGDVDVGPLVVAVADAAGGDVHAGVAWRPGLGGVRDAATEAHEVLRLAARLGRSPGPHRLDDVLLEHAVSRPGSARDRLLDLLAPIAGRTDLLATLEGWFDADFDRRRAAAALHVHPNTLDYRLRRIAELTGLDPGTARGLQLLGAALTARRLAVG